jgi:hypothetical protein
MNAALLAQLLTLGAQLPGILEQIKGVVGSASPETLDQAQAEFADAVAGWNAAHPQNAIAAS